MTGVNPLLPFATHLRLIVLLPGLLMMIPLQVQAFDCSDMPGNMVENCDFDSDIASWQTLFGDSQFFDFDGYLTLGTAGVSGGPTGNGFEYIFRQCISPVEPNTTYTFGAAIKALAPPPDECELFVATRSEVDCSGGGTFVDSEIVPELDVWIPVPESQLTTTESTVAVSFQYRCVRAAGPFGTYLDDAYFGIPPLEHDGFETTLDLLLRAPMISQDCVPVVAPDPVTAGWTLQIQNRNSSAISGTIDAVRVLDDSQKQLATFGFTPATIPSVDSDEVLFLDMLKTDDSMMPANGCETLPCGDVVTLAVDATVNGVAHTIETTVFVSCLD